MRDVTHDTTGRRVGEDVCSYLCKTHKGDVQVTLGLPCPLSVTVETCLISVEGR